MLVDFYFFLIDEETRSVTLRYELQLENIMKRIYEHFKNTQDWVLGYPGFFTPFKDGIDLTYTLVSPVVAPVIYTATSCQCLSEAFYIMALTTPVKQLASVPANFFNKKEWVELVSEMMGALTYIFLLQSLWYGSLAIISIVGAPVGIATRTAATFFDKTMTGTISLDKIVSPTTATP